MAMHPHVKFSHSLTLDSGHIWTLLGTFSWVHNNSRARLVIVTPTKISFPGFFVWLSKVIIPTRHWRNRAFLSLWNTNFISIRQAVHNAPIHFTQMVDIMVIYTNALTWIILMGSANVIFSLWPSACQDWSLPDLTACFGDLSSCTLAIENSVNLAR